MGASGRPAMRKLELDITYVCGLDCLNCNRMTGVAPCRPEEITTLDQVNRLIADSARLAWPWTHWYLIGGEPTTHPDLDRICAAIAEYRTCCNSSLVVTLATHGHGERTRRRIDEVRGRFPWLAILDSHKNGPDQTQHRAACVAPVDLDPVWAAAHRYTGCSVSYGCGLGFNWSGFFPCAIAGAIDRVFELGGAIPDLEHVTEAALVEQWQTYCRLCGTYRPIHEPGATLLSPAWRTALARRDGR